MKNLPLYILLIALALGQYTIYQQRKTIDNYKVAVAELTELTTISNNSVEVCLASLKTVPKTIVKAYLVGVSDAEQCIVNENAEKCYKVNEVTIRYGELNE
jgi:hypothetical protein